MKEVLGFLTLVTQHLWDKHAVTWNQETFMLIINVNFKVEGWADWAQMNLSGGPRGARQTDRRTRRHRFNYWILMSPGIFASRKSVLNSEGKKWDSFLTPRSAELSKTTWRFHCNSAEPKQPTFYFLQQEDDAVRRHHFGWRFSCTSSFPSLWFPIVQMLTICKRDKTPHFHGSHQFAWFVSHHLCWFVFW